MSIFASFCCMGDDEEHPAPIVYQASHILPTPGDDRGGSFDLGLIPGYAARQGVEFGDDRLGVKFWGRVQKDAQTGCWLWVGGKTGAGYGSLRYQGKMQLAHRVSYETLVGEIPPGFQIDHQCRVRTCVFPRHLEAVTSRTNNLRAAVSGTHLVQALAGTHCIRGHSYAVFGVYVDPKSGKVKCKACRRNAADRYEGKPPRFPSLTPNPYNFPDDEPLDKLPAVWPYLRVSLSEVTEQPGETVVLDRAQVIALRNELTGWLARTLEGDPS